MFSMWNAFTEKFDAAIEQPIELPKLPKPTGPMKGTTNAEVHFLFMFFYGTVAVCILAWALFQ